MIDQAPPVGTASVQSVKPLQWIVRGKSSLGPAVYAGAFGVSRFYSITGTEGDWTLSYPGADCMMHIDGIKTQHAAREAAQADYTKKANDAYSAVPSPQPDHAGEIERLTAENAELRRKLEAAEVFEAMFKAQRDELLQTPTPQTHVKALKLAERLADQVDHCLLGYAISRQNGISIEDAMLNLRALCNEFRSAFDALATEEAAPDWDLIAKGVGKSSVAELQADVLRLMKENAELLARLAPSPQPREEAP